MSIPSVGRIWQCRLWHESTPGHCHPSQLDSSLRSPRGKLASVVPVSFFCDNKQQSRTISRRKRHPIKCSILTLFVAAAATIYQEPNFWTRLRTEAQEVFAFLFDHFRVESIAMHNLQEIQFVEFMGDLYNLTPPHSNYLICFISINMVYVVSINQQFTLKSRATRC